MTIHSNGSEDPDCTIPVIDLSQKDDVVAKELVHAFSAIGFATLINHNVEQTTIEKGFAASKSFFNLPAEAKLQCEYQSHLSNRGYIKMGSESHETQPDQKETFDIGKEGEVGLETPWPSMLPSFKDDLLHYFKEFDLLNLRLMKLLAIGLQLADVNFFVDRCNQKHCNLRLLHYPELKREVNDTVIVRGASHTDFGSITLLSQDMIGGLRVKQRNGRWASVTPVKGSIIVNVGEMMQ